MKAKWFAVNVEMINSTFFKSKYLYTRLRYIKSFRQFFSCSNIRIMHLIEGLFELFKLFTRKLCSISSLVVYQWFLWKLNNRRSTLGIFAWMIKEYYLLLAIIVKIIVKKFQPCSFYGGFVDHCSRILGRISIKFWTMGNNIQEN